MLLLTPLLPGFWPQVADCRDLARFATAYISENREHRSKKGGRGTPYELVNKPARCGSLNLLRGFFLGPRVDDDLYQVLFFVPTCASQPFR